MGVTAEEFGGEAAGGFGLREGRGRQGGGGRELGEDEGAEGGGGAVEAGVEGVWIEEADALAGIWEREFEGTGSGGGLGEVGERAGLEIEIALGAMHGVPEGAGEGEEFVAEPGPTLGEAGGDEGGFAGAGGAADEEGLTGGGDDGAGVEEDRLGRNLAGEVIEEVVGLEIELGSGEGGDGPGLAVEEEMAVRCGGADPGEVGWGGGRASFLANEGTGLEAAGEGFEGWGVDAEAALVPELAVDQEQAHGGGAGAKSPRRRGVVGGRGQFRRARGRILGRRALRFGGG